MRRPVCSNFSTPAAPPGLETPASTEVRCPELARSIPSFPPAHAGARPFHTSSPELPDRYDRTQPWALPPPPTFVSMVVQSNCPIAAPDTWCRPNPHRIAVIQSEGAPQVGAATHSSLIPSSTARIPAIHATTASPTLIRFCRLATLVPGIRLGRGGSAANPDRKSPRLNSSH